MKAFTWLLSLGYPFVVFVGLWTFDPRGVALVLAGILTVRLLFALRRAQRPDLVSLGLLAGLMAIVLGLAAAFNEQRFLFFVPVLVNAALLLSFARTLGGEISMVETFARLQGHTLSPEKRRYCRHVTQAWCLFFIANGGVIAYLALTARVVAWTIYTGLVAYMLVGLGVAVEHVFRAWRFRDYRDGTADAILRRLFPPREVAP
ncbi:MAG: hypothetical protein ACREMB_15275 [Candidatus Rokuibacteriota bacterium]